MLLVSLWLTRNTPCLFIIPLTRGTWFLRQPISLLQGLANEKFQVAVNAAELVRRPLLERAVDVGIEAQGK